MSDAWVIAGFYFRRLVRKPLLILFLLAIPFSLLLAEFAAFGRPVVSKNSGRIPVRLSWQNHSPEADHFVQCLAQNFQLSRDKGANLVNISGDSHVQVSAQFRSASASDFILESSLVKICSFQAVQPKAVTYSVLVDQSAPKPHSSNFFAHFFPGLALFGALFLSQAMASLVWRDYERTVQRRLLTMPVSPIALVFGPLLFLAAGSAAALLLILAICALVSNPAALQSPVIWILAIGFALCASGLQLAIGLAVRSNRAAQAMSASVNMLLAFLGGGFVPLSLYPAFLRTLAYALPNGAAQAGIFQTLESPGNLQDIFWRVAAVWAWAFVLISAAISMQNRRMHS